MKKIITFLLLGLGAASANAQCGTYAAPVYTSPFLETFPASSLPTCWTEGGVNIWEYDNASFTGQAAYGAANAGEHTGTPGSNSIFMDGSNNNSGEVSTLTTPFIDISTLAIPTLMYWVFSNDINNAAGCNNDFMVEVYDGTNWNMEDSWSENFGSMWVRRAVDLTGYTGTVQVRFTVTAMTCGSSFYNDILLDDIAVVDCTPTTSTISAQSCGYYTAPSGAQLYAAGTYTDTIKNSVGCDSIITINLSESNTYATISEIACGVYVAPSGAQYGASGVYSDTIANAAGCDSVLTINLTVNNSFSTLTEAICNSYTAPSGVVYTTSGVYSDTIPNAVGCDSIITVNLTVSYNNNVTLFVSTCGDPYTSNAGNTYNSSGVYIENYQTVNGCDSTLYINLTISQGNTSTNTVTACAEYTSDAGNVYTATGTYTETFTGATGCDSIITQDITIENIVLTTTVNILTITANEVGASYQWVDCNNGNADIPGETSPSFTTTLNGDYACKIVKNTCSGITDCVRIGSLSVEEEATQFSIYPNPSNGAFIVELNDLTDNSTVVEVSTVDGKVVYSQNVKNVKTNISLNDIETGMYVITISNANSKSRKTIVIE